MKYTVIFDAVFYSQYSQQHVSAGIPTGAPHRQDITYTLWIKTHHTTCLSHHFTNTKTILTPTILILSILSLYLYYLK